MFVLRCTAKLLQRMKVAPEEAPPSSSGRLGDWYANLLVRQRAQLVLCVSERTLLPVVVPAKDIRALPKRLVAGLGEVLRALGVPEEEVAKEMGQMADCTVAKTASRQVLGSMNDFACLADAPRKEPESLLELSLWLAQAPCSPLKMERPRDVTLSVFGVHPPGRIGSGGKGGDLDVS